MNIAKHIIRVVIAWLFMSSLAYADFDVRYDKLSTLDGSEYLNARLKRIEGNDVVVFYSSGIVRIPISNLPDNVLASIDLPTRADIERENIARQQEEQRRIQEMKQEEQRRVAKRESDLQELKRKISERKYILNNEIKLMSQLSPQQVKDLLGPPDSSVVSTE